MGRPMRLELTNRYTTRGAQHGSIQVFDVTVIVLRNGFCDSNANFRCLTIISRQWHLGRHLESVWTPTNYLKIVWLAEFISFGTENSLEEWKLLIQANFSLFKNNFLSHPVSGDGASYIQAKLLISLRNFKQNSSYYIHCLDSDD